MTVQKGILIVSILLYVGSLFSPTLEEFDLFDSHPEILPGYLVFVWGWYAISFLHFAWFGNVSWLIALLLFRKKKHKAFLIFSLITSLLCIDSYFYPSERFLGFYLWNLALNLPLVVALIQLVSKEPKTNLASS